MSSTKTYDIEQKVKIRPRAKIYVGEIGMALIVTENLSFMVRIYREDISSYITMWFEYEELEFL